jgi:hypothetical protein
MAILAPDFVTPAAATMVDNYTAGTTVSTMPLANLLTDEPSDSARLLTHDPFDSYWEAVFGPINAVTSPVRNLSGIGLVNGNLSRFGFYRVIADTGVAFDIRLNYYQRLAPTALLASTNTSGAVTDVDESPRSPDGLWITPTTLGTEWQARFSFGTPAATPRVGSNRQTFVVWAKRVNGDVTFEWPLLTAHLYESGVFKADLGCRVVSSATGQILVFRWDASLLSTASGADVEVLLKASGRSPASGTSSVGIHLGALAWDSEKASPAPAFDSGWLASPFDQTSSQWGGTAADEMGAAPSKNLQHFPATAWASVKWLAVMVSDDQADASYTYSATGMAPPAMIRVPDGYTQAGHTVAGAAFIPSILNFAKGPLLGTRESSIRLETLGGQEGGSRRRPRRVMPVTLEHLTDAEGYSLFDRVDWRKGSKLPMLVVKFPDGDAASQLATLWCTLESPQGLTRGVPNKQSWAGTFVEKL